MTGGPSPSYYNSRRRQYGIFHVEDSDEGSSNSSAPDTLGSPQ